MRRGESPRAPCPALLMTLDARSLSGVFRWMPGSWCVGANPAPFSSFCLEILMKKLKLIVRELAMESSTPSRSRSARAAP